MLAEQRACATLGEVLRLLRCGACRRPVARGGAGRQSVRSGGWTACAGGWQIEITLPGVGYKWAYRDKDCGGFTAFRFDQRACFPVPTWQRPIHGAERRGLDREADQEERSHKQPSATRSCVRAWRAPDLPRSEHRGTLTTSRRTPSWCRRSGAVETRISGQSLRIPTRAAPCEAPASPRAGLQGRRRQETQSRSTIRPTIRHRTVRPSTRYPVPFGHGFGTEA